MYLVNLHPPFNKGNPPIFKGGWVIGLTNPSLKMVVTSTLIMGGTPFEGWMYKKGGLKKGG